MYEKLIDLKDNFLFCIATTFVGILIMIIASVIIIITLPMYCLFWINPVFEIYQNLIWKIYNILFQIGSDDEI